MTSSIILNYLPQQGNLASYLPTTKQSRQLLDLLQCSDDAFEGNLSKLDKVCLNLFANSFSQDIKMTYLILFNERLARWKPPNIADQWEFSSKLLAFQEAICPSNCRRIEMLVFLVDILKERQLILKLLEQTIIGERLGTLFTNDIYQKFKGKLCNYLKKSLNSITQGDKTIDNILTTAKIVKVYSWISNDLKELQVDQLMQQLPEQLNMDLLMQLIQTHHQLSCLTLQKKILGMKIQRGNQLDFTVTFSKDIPPELITDEVIGTILSSTESPVNLFQECYKSEQDKVIVLCYDSTNIQKSAFENIISVDLLQTIALSKLKKTFVDIMTNAKNILDKIIDNWKVSALNIRKGQLLVHQYSDQQKLRVLENALEVWLNVFKIMKATSINAPRNNSQFNNRSVTSSPPMSQVPLKDFFKKLLLFVEELPLTVMDKISCILLQIQYFVPSTFKFILSNQENLTIFSKQIMNCAKLEKESFDSKYLRHIMSFVSKMLEYSSDDPKNELFQSEDIIRLILRMDLKKGQQDYCEILQEGPALVGVYKEFANDKILFHELMLKQCPSLNDFIDQLIQQLIPSVDMSKRPHAAPIDHLRFKLLAKLMKSRGRAQGYFLENLEKNINQKGDRSIRGLPLFLGDNEQLPKAVNNSPYKYFCMLVEDIIEVGNSLVTQIQKGCLLISERGNLLRYILDQFLILIKDVSTESLGTKVFSNVGKVVDIILHLKIMIKKMFYTLLDQIDSATLNLLIAESDQLQRSYPGKDMLSLYKVLVLVGEKLAKLIAKFPIADTVSYLKESKNFLLFTLKEQGSVIFNDYLDYLYTILQSKEHDGFQEQVGIALLNYKWQLFEIVNVISKRSYLCDDNLDQMPCLASEQKQAKKFFLKLKQEGKQYSIFVESLTKSALIKLLVGTLVMNRYSKDIYANNMIFTGNKNFTVLQKHLLVFLLQEINTREVTFGYIMLIKSVLQAVIQNTNALQKLSPRNQSERPLQQQGPSELELGAEREADTSIEKLKSQVIAKFLKARSCLQSKEEKEMNEQMKIIVQSLLQYKNGGLSSKNNSQSTSLIGSLITSLEVTLQKQQLSVQEFSEQLCWINIFLKDQLNLTNSDILTSSLVELFLKKIAKWLETADQRKSVLKESILLLERLIPHDFAVEQSDNLVNFSIQILQMIVTIIRVIPGDDRQFNNSNQVFLSLIHKLITSKREELSMFISLLIQEIPSNRYPDVICLEMEGKMKEAAMELDLKGYFQRAAEKQQSQYPKIQAEFNDFIQYFTKRYQKKQQRLIMKVLGITSLKKKMIEVQGRPKIRLIWSKEDRLDYCKCIESQTINYKPSFVFRATLSMKIKEICKEQIEKICQSTQNFLLHLCKILENNPILLPSIVFHPICGTNEENSQSFFMFLVQKQRKAHSQDLRKFLLFCLLDHNIVIRGKHSYHLFADYLCYWLVKTFIQQLQKIRGQQTEHIEMFLLLLYFSQIHRFSKYCNMRLTEKDPSLRENIQQMVKRISGVSQKEVEIRYACLISLGLWYQQSTFQKLSYQIRPRYMQQTFQTSFHPFQGVFKIKQQDDNIDPSLFCYIDERQLIEDMEQGLEELKSRFNESSFSIQQVDLHRKLEWRIDDKLLRATGHSFADITQYRTPRTSKSSYNSNFQSLVSSMYRWFRQDKNISNMSLGQSVIYEERHIQFSQDDLENQYQSDWEALLALRVPQRSKYAPADQSLTFVSPIEEELREDNHSFHQLLFSHIPEAFKEILEIPSLRTLKSREEDKEKEQEEINLSQCAEALIESINKNKRSLNQEQLSLRELRGKSEEEIINFLKLKELECEFDFREQTMSVQAFEEYCLANLTKLQQLDSVRRNKVSRMEQEMMQMYVRRTSSSDSVDYIIDIIDQNYQLLHNLSRGRSKSEPDVFRKKDTKLSKIKSLNLNNVNEEMFPTIDEEIIYTVICTLYQQISRFKLSNIFIPFLENIKYQTQIINTLLFIYRDPFNNGVFPDKFYDVPKDTTQNDPQSATLIKNAIVTILCQFYKFCFYRNDQFLAEKSDEKGIKGIHLKPFVQEQINQSNIYEIISFLADSYQQVNLSTLNILRLLKAMSEIPEAIQASTMKLLNILNDNSLDEEDEEEFNYCRLKENLRLSYYLQDLSKSEDFKKKIREQNPLNELKWNIFFTSLFIDLEIYEREDLKNFHQKLLEQEERTGPQLFFCGEVIRIYTEEEIKTAQWVNKHQEIYSKIISKICKLSKAITKQNWYPLTLESRFIKTLGFQEKCALLHAEVQEIISQNCLDNLEPTIYSKRKKGIFQSAFLDLRYRPSQFWLTDFSLNFVGEQGNIESGYGLGVEKEWYSLITKGMVNLDYGLFTKTSKHYYFFSRESWINPRHLQFFEFIGKLFALSIIKKEYFMAPSFSLVIYKMILGEKIEVEDLIQEFDEGEVLRNLQKLRSFTDDSMFWQNFVYENVQMISDKEIKNIKLRENSQNESNLYLLKEHLQIKEKESEEVDSPTKTAKVFKVGEEIQLKPGGASIPVTLDNLQEYISLTKQKIYEKLIKSVEKQSQAFLDGFKKIISLKYIKKFSAEELRTLAEGSNNLSVKEIKDNVNLNRFSDTDQTIIWFWELFEELTHEDRAYFIQHWTGTPKLPVDGLKEMDLSINRVDNDKRIFSQTCFNSLNMSHFQSKKGLEQAMNLAINTMKMGVSILEDNRNWL